MSQHLRLPTDYINRTAHTASKRYKRYFVPKKSGGMREIHHPSKELKALQRWILKKVLTNLPVHQAACAYERGSTISAHASLHVTSSFLLRLDFRDFFPSITQKDIAFYLARRSSELPEGWTLEDTNLLGRICCRYGRLTIGAPTSPSPSNRLCLTLDQRLSDMAQELRITYSRYADDLFFSATQPDILRSVPDRTDQIVSSLDCPAGLSINPQKTRHTSKRNRRIVTGLILSSDGTISIGRQQKRRIRSMIHTFEDLSDRDRTWLRGMLAHCRSVEPAFVSRLFIKFGAPQMDIVLGPPGESPRS